MISTNFKAFNFIIRKRRVREFEKFTHPTNQLGKLFIKQATLANNPYNEDILL